MCPYRHNLIFLTGTHCAYTGTAMTLCPCELCVGFRPWPFHSSSVWNGIRYKQVYVKNPSPLLSRRTRPSHADDDSDESDSKQAARVVRRQRRRHNTLVCTQSRSRFPG
jgi:hypothetical protein